MYYSSENSNSDRCDTCRNKREYSIVILGAGRYRNLPQFSVSANSFCRWCREKLFNGSVDRLVAKKPQKELTL